MYVRIPLCLYITDVSYPVKNALRLQQKRKVTQKVHSSPKRIRTTQDSPPKMVTRRDSMKVQDKQPGSSHLTFDCVLLDRPSSLHAPRKGKEPVSDREQSPEIAILSLSPEIPPSSLPSDAEVAPTSEPAEEELMFASSEPPEDVPTRSTVMLFGPPSKSVKTYAKRKVGRPRKSLG